MQNQSREYELKLTITPDDISALKGADILNDARAQTASEFNNHYFDDAKRSLEKSGAALRIRHQGGKFLQTLKSNDVGLRRNEWEVEVPTGEPDLDAVGKQPGAKKVAKRVLQEELQPIFETTFIREAWTVERDGAEIEVALDKGDVRAGSGRENISEVELELKKGEPQALFEVAFELLGVASLRPALSSKSDRGYRLSQASSDRLNRNLRLTFHRDTPVRDAARLLIHACLEQILHNEKLLREGRRPDALHQTRVGFRRLRAALSLFSPMFNGEMDGAKADVNKVARLLGDARDLDVFLQQTSKNVPPALVDAPGFHDLIEEYARRRNRAYSSAIEALEGKEFARMILTILHVAEAGAWRADKGAAKKIGAFAGAVLNRKKTRLVRLGRTIKKLGPGERHELRIKAKKLAYMAEFFRSIAKRDSYRKTMKALKTIQGVLGNANDARVTAAMMAQIPTELPASKANFAAGAIFGLQQRARDPASAVRRSIDKLFHVNPLGR